jgi:hypothetical protein
MLTGYRALLLLVALLCLPAAPGKAQQVTPAAAAALSEALQNLEYEKSSAEAYAGILGTIGPSDMAVYLRGAQLYADAKAEFDKMIKGLRVDLMSDRNPTQSDDFKALLQQAAQRRIAFTSFVTAEIVNKQRAPGLGLPVVLDMVPALVEKITNAGLSIWKAYHDASKERRDAILAEVDELRWRSFKDLTKK